MATLIPSLLSLTILTLTCSALANNFIEMSCKKTTHPAECTAILMPYAATVGESPMKLAETAITMSITKSVELGKYFDEESKKPELGPKEQTAMKDCFEAAESILGLLGKSIEEMRKMANGAPDQFAMHKNNVQTWISSSLSDYSTCADGFTEMEADPTLTETITTKMSEAERDASITLALINQLQGLA